MTPSKKRVSVPRNLDDTPSFTHVTLRSDGLNGLQSSMSTNGDIENISLSQSLLNSYSATPEKAGVNKRGFMSRKRQLTGDVKKGAAPGVRGVFQSVFNSSVASNDGSRIQNLLNTNQHLEDSVASEITPPVKLSVFCARRSKSSIQSTEFQNALNESTVTGVQSSRKTRIGLPANNGRSNFQDAFDSSVESKTAKDNSDVSGESQLVESCDSLQVTAEPDKISSAFVKRKLSRATGNAKSNFHTVFDSSVETNNESEVQNSLHMKQRLEDSVISESTSPMKLSAFRARRPKNCIQSTKFQNVLNKPVAASVQSSQKTRSGKSNFQHAFDSSIESNDSSTHTSIIVPQNNADSPSELTNRKSGFAKRRTIQNSSNGNVFESAFNSSVETSAKHLSQEPISSPPKQEASQNEVDNEADQDERNLSVQSTASKNLVEDAVHQIPLILVDVDCNKPRNIDLSETKIPDSNAQQEQSKPTNEIVNCKDNNVRDNSDTSDAYELRLTNSDLKDHSNKTIERSLIVGDVREVSVPNCSLKPVSMVADNSFSQPSAVLHIESDYDSMDMSDIDESVLGEENMVELSHDISRTKSPGSAKNIMESGKVLSEINGSNNRTTPRKLKSHVNESVMSNENILSVSTADRIAKVNENYDSMEMTSSIVVEKTVTNISVKRVSIDLEHVQSNRKSRRLSIQQNQSTILNTESNARVDEKATSINDVNIQCSNVDITGKNASVSHNSKETTLARRTSLRNRDLNSSEEKSQPVGLDRNTSKSSGYNVTSTSKSLNNSTNRREFNRSKNVTPHYDSVKENSIISTYEAPISELRRSYRVHSSANRDIEMVNSALTYNKKPPTDALMIQDNNSLVKNKNKTPKLKKPKRWVTSALYKFVIDKLEPKYGIKSRQRAEKFVEFLCNQFTVVLKLNVKKDYKKQVDILVIEMAKLHLIENYWDFWNFVNKYLPHHFAIKSIPMTMPFGEEPLVDLPPRGQILGSIL